MLIQAVCSRAIIWMMAKEYYEMRPYLRPLFAAVEAIPVDRGGNLSQAPHVPHSGASAAGRVLGIFPEGEDRDDIAGPAAVSDGGGVDGGPKTGVHRSIRSISMGRSEIRGDDRFAAVVCPHRATLRFGDEVQLDRSTTGQAGMVEGSEADLEEAVEEPVPGPVPDAHRRSEVELKAAGAIVNGWAVRDLSDRARRL